MSDSLDDWGGAEFALAADRLDTPEVLEAADPGNVLRQVATAAAQVRTALLSCQEADLSAFTPAARPRAIVTVGLGGAGLAGEMLGAVTGPGSPVQVFPSPAERLPGWVGAADTVIAVSASGASTHTLAIAAEAARRGCPLACVGAKGSPLQRIAEQNRAAFIPVEAGPAGPVLPRAALWGLAIPLLVIADRLGVARLDAEVYEKAARRLEEVSHQCRPASESFVNPGKSLALDLVGSLPVVWGTSPLSGMAARRFAAQISENAKYPAIAGVLPEAARSQVATFDGPFVPGAHRLAADEDPRPETTREGASELAGLAGLEDLSSWELNFEDAEMMATARANGFTPLRLVLITDPDAEQQTVAHQQAVTELASERGIGLSELGMDGEHPLVRLAGVVQLTDYASVYLAIASGIDPGAAAALSDLQARIE
jgi:glucose/mannose-6-phosphate isomerase